MTEASEHELERRKFAKEVAKETISQTFDMLGIDISTPEKRQEFRDLISWLRGVQKFSSNTGSAALWAIVVLFITGAGYAFWTGLKAYLLKGLP